MTKQRDIFKVRSFLSVSVYQDPGRQRAGRTGRVKRLLKEQKDMGQVGEPAVQSCVAAIEAFVHDLGRKLKVQAESQDENAAITPVELKQVVLAHPEFAFLQEKVASIDENDAKYHKSHAKKKKTTAAAAVAAKPTKKRNAAAAVSASASTNGAKAKKASKKAPTRAKKAKTTAAESSVTVVATPIATDKAVPVPPSSAKKTQEIEIEEDDNYDESDSE